MKQAEHFWKQMYDRHAGMLRGVCLRYVGELATAEDLVQETFLAAMEKHHTYRGRGTFSGWLRKIAVNQALMYLRHGKRHPMETMDAEQAGRIPSPAVEEPSATPKAIIERAAFTEAELLGYLQQLPEQYRLGFNLYVMDGLKHREIAKYLNISTGTSKSNLSRARQWLTDRLYLDAKVRQPERKRAFFWWLGGGPAIDRAYQRGLRHLTPDGSSSGWTSSLQGAAGQSATKAVAWMQTLAIGSWLAPVALVGTVSVILHQQTSKAPQLPQPESITLIAEDTVATDTLLELTLPPLPKDSATPTPVETSLPRTTASTLPEEPVDTLYVRETVTIRVPVISKDTTQ